MTTITTNQLASVTGGTSSPDQILGVCKALDAGRAASQTSNNTAGLDYTSSTMGMLGCWDRIKAAGGTPLSTP
jgi:bacteriocin-like protein